MCSDYLDKLIKYMSLKNSEYYKLHYMYLYWVNLNLVDKYD